MNLWSLLATLALAQGPDLDSSASYEGIVQRGASGDWYVLLPHPLTAAGIRTRSLSLGREARLSRWEGRIVRAQGRVVQVPGAQLALRWGHFDEVTPPGTVSRTITPMFNQRAILTIAPYPQRVAWTDSLGDSTGVAPAIVFTLTNHSETPLEIEFRTNDVVCATITRTGESQPGWTYEWQGDYVNRRLTVALGTVVRWVVPVPPSGMPRPGVYTVEASLCGARDFRARASFSVQ